LLPLPPFSNNILLIPFFALVLLHNCYFSSPSYSPSLLLKLFFEGSFCFFFILYFLFIPANFLPFQSFLLFCSSILFFITRLLTIEISSLTKFLSSSPLPIFPYSLALPLPSFLLLLFFSAAPAHFIIISCSCLFLLSLLSIKFSIGSPYFLLSGSFSFSLLLPHALASSSSFFTLYAQFQLSSSLYLLPSQLLSL
jgi:hypothetical protein